MSRPLVAAAVVALLALFSGLSLWEMAGDALTSDERIHLPVGYAYWKAREFRLNPEHPPLVKLLCSAPLLAMDLQMPSTTPSDSEMEYQANPNRNPQDDLYNAYQQLFGSKFLFTQDADQILFWGRLPALGLGLLLGWFVFRWAWQLNGHAGAGLLALFLLALEPTILAHSHYVTTDVALACFSVMAIYFLWRFSQESRIRHFWLASLGAGLALASKFSAVFLVPVFFLLLILAWPAGRPAGAFPFRDRPWGARLFACIGAALVMALVVQACYLFSPDLTLYLKGIRSVNINHVEGYRVYIAGRFFGGGAWWYPLYAFLLKTPLPTLLALAVALGGCLRRKLLPGRSLLFVLLPAAVYVMAVCAYADNLGVRYMIPAASFLLVLAGTSYFTFVRSRKTRILGALLAMWLLLSVLRVSPHYIAYFNELIGGAENGPYYLDDSNIDWGQDLKRLAQYLHDNHVRQPILSFWGPAPPEYYGDRYGVEFKPWTRAMAESARPPAGVYAISVNNLVALRRMTGLGSNLDWLQRFEPTRRVGYSIYIYRFP
ncbi:MAG: glycosyltransferase family 39 protein [Acidobacteria bacterium]|nr:glycosyltransferase family 39 protein [Acidobacteriota bacterium]